jgi:hypothetical protein
MVWSRSDGAPHKRKKEKTRNSKLFFKSFHEEPRGIVTLETFTHKKP